MEESGNRSRSGGETVPKPKKLSESFLSGWRLVDDEMNLRLGGQSEKKSKIEIKTQHKEDAHRGFGGVEGGEREGWTVA